MRVQVQAPSQVQVQTPERRVRPQGLLTSATGRSQAPDSGTDHLGCIEARRRGAGTMTGTSAHEGNVGKCSGTDGDAAGVPRWHAVTVDVFAGDALGGDALARDALALDALNPHASAPGTPAQGPRRRPRGARSWRARAPPGAPVPDTHGVRECAAAGGRSGWGWAGRCSWPSAGRRCCPPRTPSRPESTGPLTSSSRSWLPAPQRPARVRGPGGTEFQDPAPPGAEAGSGLVPP